MCLCLLCHLLLLCRRSILLLRLLRILAAVYLLNVSQRTPAICFARLNHFVQARRIAQGSCRFPYCPILILVPFLLTLVSCSTCSNFCPAQSQVVVLS